jgi:hypothetical protein
MVWVQAESNGQDDDEAEDEVYMATLAKEFTACQTAQARCVLSARDGILDVAPFLLYGLFGSLYSKLSVWAGPRSSPDDRDRGLIPMARALLRKAVQNELYEES